MKNLFLICFLFLCNSLVFAVENLPAEITVYKDPNCGCCSKWVTYLRDNGFTVTDVNVDNITTYKEKYGVPAHLGSCHTGVVAGYAIEGHVPAADIIKLLKDKTDIIGLTVPGMPVGAPGMEMGDRLDAFDVMAINKDGTSYIFNSYNQPE